MDMVQKLVIVITLVAAAEVSTPAAEVQNSLVVPGDMVERVEKDLSREWWEVEPGSTTFLVDLVEVQVLMDMEEVVEEEEATLEEAVGNLLGILAEAVEDLIMLVKINKTNVAIDHLAMVR